MAAPGDALDNALNGDGGAWCDDVRTPRTESCAQVAGRAFDRALEDLAERLGPRVRTWRWSRLQQVTFTHPTLGRSGIALLETLVNRGHLRYRQERMLRSP